MTDPAAVTDQRWSRIAALFEAALERPRAQRRDWLRGECGDDGGLYREVEEMLSAHHRTGGILDGSVAPLAASALAAAEAPGEGGRDLRGRRVGPYRLLRAVGKGGMGEVWQAFDERLDRFAALKFLAGELAAHGEAKARFLDEARAVSRLDHPAICTVFDVGEDDEGRLYIAMSFHEGTTLADRLGDGPLPVAECVELAIRTAEGLEAAHAAGVVHRDVKPSNLLLTHRGEVKIIDFGVAKLHFGSSVVTRSGFQVGTLSYMSPEQARGAEVDARSDVWSLGVVLFEMLSGHRPFQRRSAYDTVEAILEAEPPSLAGLRPGLPAALVRLVERALAKRPEERFPSATVMLQALRGLRDEETGTPAPPPVELPPPPPLPLPLTSFVGREEEVERITGLLRDARLITLIGPPGSGKTRLALEVARRCADLYPQGVWFVPLAAVSKPRLLPGTVAATLGLDLPSTRPAVDSLVQRLGRCELLLVLDNFEHLIDAAPVVSGMLSACPGLRTVVTSQVLLRLGGEHAVRVAPLPLPAAADREALERSPAARLFLERARAVRPELELDAGGARAVAEICHRLEGLPLALELAASRVRLFPPRALLRRLESRLDLEASGVDRPQRHRTLRAALAWSNDLLSDEQQALLRRLAVFQGGVSLEAVEGVAGPFEGDPVEGLTALVDHSFLQRDELDGDGGEPRFRMLETVREYALERLDEAGEGEAVRGAHAALFLELAEQAAEDLTGPRQTVWLDRLEAERANLRTALEWAVEEEDTETALRLATALWRFWLVRGPLDEARRRLERSLDLPGADDASAAELRARALDGLGTLLHNLGENREARRRLEECLEIYRRRGDRRGVAAEINNLAWVACELSDLETAVELAREGLELNRELGEVRGEALALNNLGWVANYRGRYREAREYHERQLALRREIGDQRGIAFALNSLAWAEQTHGAHTRALALLEKARETLAPVQDRLMVSFGRLIRCRVLRDRGWLDRAAAVAAPLEVERQAGGNLSIWVWALTERGALATDRGRHDAAGDLLPEALAGWRSLGTPWGEAWAHFELGRLELARGDLAAAEERLRRSLEIRRDLRDARGAAESLECLALLPGAGDSGEGGAAEEAVRLLGAAEGLREEVEAFAGPVWLRRLEERAEELERRLGGERFETLRAAGREERWAMADRSIG